jgi:hypothetical protein
MPFVCFTPIKVSKPYLRPNQMSQSSSSIPAPNDTWDAFRPPRRARLDSCSPRSHEQHFCRCSIRLSANFQGRRPCDTSPPSQSQVPTKILAPAPAKPDAIIQRSVSAPRHYHRLDECQAAPRFRRAETQQQSIAAVVQFRLHGC